MFGTPHESHQQALSRARSASGVNVQAISSGMGGSSTISQRSAAFVACLFNPSRPFYVRAYVGVHGLAYDEHGVPRIVLRYTAGARRRRAFNPTTSE